MVENRNIQGETKVPITVETPHIFARMRQLLEGFRKFRKARQLYAVDNEIVQKLSVDMKGLWSKFLQEAGELVWTISSDGFYYENEKIMDAEDISALCASMYRQGLRNITFTMGAEEELLKLADVLSQSATGDSKGGKDLITQLWEANFTYISYRVAEETLISSTTETMMGKLIHIMEEGKVPVRKEIERLRMDMQKPEGLPPEVGEASPIQPPETPSELAATAVLSESELEDIYLEFSNDNEYSLALRIIEIVAEMSCTERFVRKRNNLINYLAEIALIPLLERGDFESACKRISYIAKILTQGFPDKQEQSKVVLRLIRARLSEPKNLDAAINILNTSYRGSGEPIEIYVSAMGRSASEALIQKISLLTNSAYSRAILDALAKIEPELMKKINKYFGSLKDSVILDVAPLLEKNLDEEGEKLLKKMLTHSMPQIRIAAINVITKTGNKKHEKELIRILEDQNEDVRAEALKAIISFKLQSAYVNVFNIISHPEFNNRSFTEKQRFAVCAAVLNPKETLSRFEKTLKKWSLFGADALTEEKLVALAGIKEIDTPEAKRVLEKAARSRNKAVSKKAKEILQSRL
ncbi:MAG: hypothetical protein Kow0090_09110 [Myxococcota bacterium]